MISFVKRDKDVELKEIIVLDLCRKYKQIVKILKQVEIWSNMYLSKILQQNLKYLTTG